LNKDFVECVYYEKITMRILKSDNFLLFKTKKQTKII